jgi:hypothetical protein
MSQPGDVRGEQAVRGRPALHGVAEQLRKPGVECLDVGQSQVDFGPADRGHATGAVAGKPGVGPLTDGERAVIGETWSPEGKSSSSRRATPAR